MNSPTIQNKKQDPDKPNFTIWIYLNKLNVFHDGEHPKAFYQLKYGPRYPRLPILKSAHSNAELSWPTGSQTVPRSIFLCGPAGSNRQAAMQTLHSAAARLGEMPRFGYKLYLLQTGRHRAQSHRKGGRGRAKAKAMRAVTPVQQHLSPQPASEAGIAHERALPSSREATRGHQTPPLPSSLLLPRSPVADRERSAARAPQAAQHRLQRCWLLPVQPRERPAKEIPSCL